MAAFAQHAQNSQADQQRVAEIANFIATDPQIQQWRQQAAARGEAFEGPAAKQQIEQYLASKGISLPDGFVIQQNGTPVKDAGFDWKPIIAMGALATGGLLGPALAGGGAAAAGGGSAGALGPTTAGTIAATSAGAAAPAGIAAGGAGTAATMAGAAGGTSLWKTLAAPAIGAGTQIAGSLIQANQNDKATQAELQKAREAQAFLEKKYEQTQNQVAPYVNMGQGALAALGNGLGVTPANPAVLQPGQSRPVGQTTSGFIPPNDFSSFKQQVQAQNPTATIPNMPQGQPVAQTNAPNSTTNLSQSSVRLQSPDGKDVQDVPADHAQYYISQGAKVVA
jgi:hypothetical protein